MSPDSTPAAPDPTTAPASIDAEGLKDAHGRTGRMLKNAGLPFEAEEFEGDEDDDSSSSSSEGEDSSSSSEEE